MSRPVLAGSASIAPVISKPSEASSFLPTALPMAPRPNRQTLTGAPDGVMFSWRSV
jgi:hypothetical protein